MKAEKHNTSWHSMRIAKFDMVKAWDRGKRNKKSSFRVEAG